MKKFIALLLTILVLGSLVACGTQAGVTVEEPVTTETPAVSQNAEVETAPDVPTVTETETPQEEPVPVVEDTPSEEEVPALPSEMPETSDTPEVPETPAQEPAAESTVLLTDVRAAIIDQLGISDPFLLDTFALLNLYGISSDLVQQSASFVTMAGTFPDEIILIEAVDEAAVSTIQACLQNRLNEVLVQSETYDAENYAAAQQCQVRVTGLHIALILSPRQAEMTAVYQSFVN